MSLSNLSSVQLAKLFKLLKQKEKLSARVEALEAKINAIDDGAAPVKRGRKAKVGRPAGKKARRTRRGNLKTGILAALKSAGAKGIPVGVLASKLKVKPNNVFSWFYTTGRKVSGIKKVGPARYALVS